jgi:NAD(P)-dependent dehydrogenase (short-subunit alcohol dehydrogenase family)
MDVVVVTGSSRGIGASVARICAQRGWAVCINSSHSHEEAEEVAASIRNDGGRAISAIADVSSVQEVEAMFEKVKQELGPVTGLVNNAGIEGSQGRVETLDAEATIKTI